MRNYCLFTVSFLFVLAACINTEKQIFTQQEKDEIAAVIKSKNELMFESWRNLDPEKAFLHHIIDKDNFMYLGVSGEKMDYAEFAKTVKEVLGSFEKANVPIHFQKIQVLSPEVVVVNAQYDVIFYKRGQEFGYPNCASTAVFVKRGNNWSLIRYHESIQLPEKQSEES